MSQLNRVLHHYHKANYIVDDFYWSPTDDFVAVTSKGDIDVFHHGPDLQYRVALRAHEVTDLVWHPDANQFVWAERIDPEMFIYKNTFVPYSPLRLANLIARDEQTLIKGDFTDPKAEYISTLAFSPDGNILAIGYATGVIELRAFSEDFSIISRYELVGSIQNLCWNTDGSMLAISTNHFENGFQYHVAVIDINASQVLWNQKVIAGRDSAQLVWVKDQLMVWDGDKTLQLIDAQTGELSQQAIIGFRWQWDSDDQAIWGFRRIQSEGDANYQLIKRSLISSDKDIFHAMRLDIQPHKLNWAFNFTYNFVAYLHNERTFHIMNLTTLEQVYTYQLPDAAPFEFTILKWNHSNCKLSVGTSGYRHYVWLFHDLA